MTPADALVARFDRADRRRWSQTPQAGTTDNADVALRAACGVFHVSDVPRAPSPPRDAPAWPRWLSKLALRRRWDGPIHIAGVPRSLIVRGDRRGDSRRTTGGPSTLKCPPETAMARGCSPGTAAFIVVRPRFNPAGPRRPSPTPPPQSLAPQSRPTSALAVAWMAATAVPRWARRAASPPGAKPSPAPRGALLAVAPAAPGGPARCGYQSQPPPTGIPLPAVAAATTAGAAAGGRRPTTRGWSALRAAAAGRATRQGHQATRRRGCQRR